MASLVDVTTPTPSGDRYALDVPDGWKQGRGAFGGLSIAALVRAIEHRVGDPARKVRTVTAELPSPVLTGAAEISVDIMRVGKSLTAARAALHQGGEIRAHAVANLAIVKPGHGPTGWRDIEAPKTPPWKDVPVVPFNAAVGAPEFTQHFEFRIVEGIPGTGKEPHVIGWIRPRIACHLQDGGYIAAMCDSFYPAAMVRFTQMRPLATITFSLEVVDGIDGLNPDAPLLYRGVVPVLRDGFFFERRELWGEDGRLVAVNHQTFAVIA
jgi:acyl-CoA thioesterase